MNANLAIVIPAYKQIFFRDTLLSILNQTCKEFTLYIGDDASPNDLYSITSNFEKEISIVYKRFDENLGSIDLVAHWNRCIDLVQDEEWIWLFSDDDILDIKCVELFYENLSTHPDECVFHFNVQVINQHKYAIGKIKKFPPVLSSGDFFSKRLKKELYSFAVEYVFRKDVFKREGGFEKFDLGWSSDDATWIKLSKNKGIRTIDGATVQWRLSGINISSILNNKSIVIRKINANISFLLWADKFLTANNVLSDVTPIIKLKWLLTMVIETPALTMKEKKIYILESLKKLLIYNLKLEALTLLRYGELKKALLKKILFHKPTNIQ